MKIENYMFNKVLPVGLFEKVTVEQGLESSEKGVQVSRCPGVQVAN